MTISPTARRIALELLDSPHTSAAFQVRPTGMYDATMGAVVELWGNIRNAIPLPGQSHDDEDDGDTIVRGLE
jgi:hypothetical protein